MTLDWPPQDPPPDLTHEIVGSDGLPFWIPDTPNDVTDAIVAGGWWEPALLPLFDRACRPDRWTVEVGAYIGDHTIALTARGPVLAIEPQALPFQLLGKNLSWRSGAWAPPGRYPWEVLQVALYSRPVLFGYAPGFAVPASPSSAFTVKDLGFGWRGRPYDSLHLPYTVGFLKIDAQGCDLHVLRGASRMINRDRPIILCEYYEPLARLHGDTYQDYLDWFRRRDYTVEPYSGDNLLGVPEEVDDRPYLETRP